MLNVFGVKSPRDGTNARSSPRYSHGFKDDEDFEQQARNLLDDLSGYRAVRAAQSRAARGDCSAQLDYLYEYNAINDQFWKEGGLQPPRFPANRAESVSADPGTSQVGSRAPSSVSVSGEVKAERIKFHGVPVYHAENDLEPHSRDVYLNPSKHRSCFILHSSTAWRRGPKQHEETTRSFKFTLSRVAPCALQ